MVDQWNFAWKTFANYWKPNTSNSFFDYFCIIGHGWWICLHNAQASTKEDAVVDLIASGFYLLLNRFSKKNEEINGCLIVEPGRAEKFLSELKEVVTKLRGKEAGKQIYSFERLAKESVRNGMRVLVYR